jgi:heme-degrading monooxygenase HmoA
MSVLMTMRVQADAHRVEEEEQATMGSILAKAKANGLISHHFYGSDREVLVVDEWPDEASFQRFFAAAPEVAGMMERAGGENAPEINFWRHLDTGDDVG